MIEETRFSDWFLNIPENKIPQGRDNPDRQKLIKREISRCMGGVFVDGIYISGWLYWHLNHWWIRDDIEDEFGNILRGKLRPSLRDNEWIVAQYLEQCRIEKKGYLHVGVRQFGKSEIMASYLAYNATLFEHTQNVIVGGNEDDLSLLKDKIDFGVKNLWGGIKIPKLTRDTKANMIKLGIKNKSNEDEVWSFLVIRNVAEGKKTEGPAGVTAKAFAIDEIGKFPFAQSFAAAKPAFMSKFGWRCVPILFGTGGSFEKGADAERFFYHPEANNFLSVKNPETGETTAIFMSGLYRLDCKYNTTFDIYLTSDCLPYFIKGEDGQPVLGKLPVDHKFVELQQIKIAVSNKEEALKKIKAEREQKALDPDQTEYLKLIMYYPLTPKECFLSSSDNFYNKEIAEVQKDRLSEEFPGLRIGMYVELEEVPEGNDTVIKHKPSSLLPITSFPVKTTENTDTPIVIIEHPMPHPPYGLYVAGIDPYRQDKAPNSDSLGAVYIFKRMYDVQADSFQDMPVAWYVGRPKTRAEWDNKARLLIKYYNAIALCENDELSFIDYMIAKGESHYLLDTPEWVKLIIPNSASVGRAKGVSSAAPKIKELLRNNLKTYMEELCTTVPLPGTTETRKILGITKIMDPMFLEEIIKWNRDGNFDREIALSLAITCARKLDAAKLQVNTLDEDPRFKKPKGYNKQKRIVMFKPLKPNHSYSNIQRLFK